MSFRGVENVIVGNLRTLMDAGPLEKLVGKEISPNGDKLAVYSGPRESTITIRSYANELDCRELESEWANTMGNGCKTVTLPAIKRGNQLNVYYVTSDERLTEYDIDGKVVDVRSEFQHIEIVHSKTFGNMLVLDGLPNLALSDLVYTESIMCRGKEDFKGKEILILRGGDGALLNELRKEDPKKVIMVEIDDMVMQACKTYLRSVCGDSLDNYQGDNYQVCFINGDYCRGLHCHMEKWKAEGKTFDYVISDLTDISITKKPSGGIWDFIVKIIDMSFSVLSPNGKYLTHATGSSNDGALKCFDYILETQLDRPVTFTKTNAFVPSFLEDWVFYQIELKKV
ncbi:Spermine synthase [Orchesella cincta]|uniref:Spermine synthase n=1 Tax=Orchesella cincta TaxID=48709 RepID=A0A1D2MNT4_ORCCI|nr:Spermine synthase [Orchesella cincta]